jgi:hypothetical protein
MAEDWRPRRGQKIGALYAWVCEEPDGGEDVAGANIPGLGGMVPLIGADRERIESFRPYAVAVAAMSGYRTRLVRFAKREVLDELPGVAEPD